MPYLEEASEGSFTPSSATSFRLIMMNQAQSEDNQSYYSNGSSGQSSPSVQVTSHPLLSPPTTGPVMLATQSSGNVVLTSSQEVMSLQEKLHALMQVVGMGGMALQQNMQTFSEKTLKEFEQLKSLLSCADVSSQEKWIHLATWAYRVDQFLTPFVSQVLPQMQESTPVIHNCLQHLLQQIHQHTTTFQEHHTTIHHHHFQFRKFQSEICSNMEQLQSSVAELLAFQDSTELEMKNMKDLLSKMTSNQEEFGKFWATEQPKLRSLIEKGKTTTQSVETLSNKLLQLEATVLKMHTQPSQPPALMESHVQEMQTMQMAISNLEKTMHTLHSTVTSKSATPHPIDPSQPIIQDFSRKLEQLSAHVQQLMSQTSMVPDHSVIFAQMRQEWHVEKQVLLQQAKQEINDITSGYRVVKRPPPIITNTSPTTPPRHQPHQSFPSCQDTTTPQTPPPPPPQPKTENTTQLTQLQQQVQQLQEQIAQLQHHPSNPPSLASPPPITIGFQKPPTTYAPSIAPPETYNIPGGLHGTRIKPSSFRLGTLGMDTAHHLAFSQRQAAKPGISQELADYYGQGGTGFQSPTSDLESHCDANIQMISGSIASAAPAVAPGFIHPLLMSVQGQKPTLTNKYQGGWITFAREWEHHMHFVLACNAGRAIPDRLLLQYLKPCLDKTDQLLLENHWEKKPHMTFQEFWDFLASMYDKDSQAQLRLAWESVKLPPGELSLERWLTFLREFHLKRDRVEDFTPQEEHKLLFKQLPRDWQQKIIQEEAKRGRNKYLVRMTNLPNLPLTLLHTLIQEFSHAAVLNVTSTTQGALIHCEDASSQTKVMGLAGNTLHGCTVKCSRVDHSLSGEQLADFITERLQTQHKLETLREVLEGAPKAKMVQQVQHGKEHSDHTPSPSPRHHPHNFPQQHTYTPTSTPPRQPSPKPHASPAAKGDPSSSSYSGKGKSHGKSKGAGKGSPRRNNSQHPDPAPSATFCPNCAQEGHKLIHAIEQCPQWQMLQGFKKGQICYHCANAGEDANHDYRKCQKKPRPWQNGAARRLESKQNSHQPAQTETTSRVSQGQQRDKPEPPSRKGGSPPRNSSSSQRPSSPHQRPSRSK